jgi:hypothetical protein
MQKPDGARFGDGDERAGGVDQAHLRVPGHVERRTRDVLGGETVSV